MKLKTTAFLPFSLVFALTLTASPAHAWELDWNSLLKKAKELKTLIVQNTFKGQSKPNRKPETTILGPLTYYVGETNTQKTFSADPNSKYRIHFSSQNSVKAEIILDGKNYELVFNEHGKCDDERIRRLKLDATNTLLVKKITGKANGSITIAITTTDIVLPPDPAQEAPPNDPSMPTDIAQSTAFLYTGDNPIQTGVQANTIKPAQVAVIKGIAYDGDLKPLSGVLVQALGHPEYGQTLTRANGGYDFAVNGGSEITLTFKKANYLPVQRHVNAKLRDFTPVLTPVVMIEVDTTVTRVALGTNSKAKAAIASPVSDTSGARKAVVFFPANTRATLQFADGSAQSVTSVNVRATEFTVGPNGSRRMPAELPPSTKYTYALALTTDEEIAAQATSIVFSQPVYHYVNNFIGFPVGTTIPVGHYNEQIGKWVAVNNGLVMKVLSVKAGVATLDVAGKGAAATAADLTRLKITQAELSTIGSLYAAGTSFWRSPIEHFSTYDMNLNTDDTITDQRSLTQGTGLDTQQDPDCPVCHGSIIETENQVLGEQVDLAGTSFYLRYNGSRIVDRTAAYTARIPITPTFMDSRIASEVLQVSIAGKTFYYSFPPTPGQTFDFVWDGQDAYDRPVSGQQILSVNLAYYYNANYANPLPLPYVFGSPLNTAFATPIPARTLPDAHIDYSFPVGTLDARTQGLGGWTLNVHHAYDIPSRTLYQGNGTTLKASQIGNSISSFAGNGSNYITSYNGKATEVGMTSPWAIAVRPDQSVLIGDGKLIRMVGMDGKILTYLGGGTDYYGENITPAQMGFGSVTGLAIDADQTLYIADPGAQRIRKVTTSNLVQIVAGAGSTPPSTTPTDARNLSIGAMKHMTLAKDGSLFVTSNNFDGILRIGSDGRGVIIPGTESIFLKSSYQPGLAVSPDGGTVYAVNNGQIYSIEMSGQIRVLQLGQMSPTEGALTIGTNQQGELFFISNLGRLYKVVANSSALINLSGDIDTPQEMAFGADQAIYVTEPQSFYVKKITSSLPGFTGSNIQIASGDGSQIFEFDSTGRHLRTLDSLTNVAIYAFNYDSSTGLLVSVADRVGKLTTITRDANGDPTAITSPFGVTTQLTTNSDGYLASAADALGNTFQFSYNTGTGLLNRFTRPSGNSSTFSYDSKNRLAVDTDALGKSQTLSRVDSYQGYSVRHTSPTGAYTDYRLGFGNGNTFVKTFPDQTQEATLNYLDGTQIVNSSDGSSTRTKAAADPRFGFAAPYSSTQSIRTPSGLTANFVNQKSITYGASSSDGTKPFVLTETNQFNELISKTTFDSETKTWTSISPLGIRTYQTLDSLGRLATVRIPGQADINYSYDSSGRVSSITQGDRVSSFTYDVNGYLHTTKNAVNRETEYIRDTLGRVMTRITPEGETSHFTYDSDGNVSSFSPPARPAYVFNFDVLGQMTTFNWPAVGSAARSSQYTYTADRKVASITRPDGAQIQYNYDSQTTRLISKSSPLGTSNYQYDPYSGNITQISAPTVTGPGVTMNFAWDGFLNTGVTWSGEVSGSATRSYDNYFRPTMEFIQITKNGSNVASAGIQYFYDLDGNYAGNDLTSLTRDPASGNPLSATTRPSLTADPITESYTYNTYGELASILTKSASGKNYIDVSITRDGLGRILTRDDNIKHYHDLYYYDAAGKLLRVDRNGVPKQAYAYDLNANRIRTTDGVTRILYTYDNRDQLLTQGNISYTYTENGERLTRTDATTGKTTSYRYDATGNLIGATLPDGRVIDYIIDAQNHRVGKKVNGVLVDTYLYLEGYGVSAVFHADGTAESYDYNQLGHLEAVNRYSNSSARTINKVITDERGSPLKVIQMATGSNVQTVVKDQEFDDFGLIMSDTNPSLLHIGFAGCLYDKDTKLCHFGAREYDAEIGQWLQTDPIGFGGGDTNLYRYTLSDPVNFVDPKGLDSFIIARGGSGGLPGHAMVAVSVPGKPDTYRLFELTQNTIKFANDAVINDIEISKKELDGLGIKVSTRVQDENQDKLAIERAMRMKTDAENSTLFYDLSNIWGMNCWGFARAVQQ